MSEDTGRRRYDYEDHVYTRTWRERPERFKLTPERVRSKVYGAIGALKRWISFYEKHVEHAPPALRPLVELKLRELRARLAAAYEAAKTLEAAGWDIYKLALTEVYVATAWRKDNRVTVPRGLPRDVEDMYKRIVAKLLYEHSTTAGRMRTGWSGFIDCDGSALEVLRGTRPADTVNAYAYIVFEDVIDYLDSKRGVVKQTNVLTVYIGRVRLGDVTPEELFAEAVKAAHGLRSRLGRDVEILDVCVVVAAP